MPRMASTFAFASWAGFHGVSALMYLSAGHSPLAELALGAGHGTLSAASILIVLRLQGRSALAEHEALGVLAAALAIAVASFVIGAGSGSAGTFAACVVSTLAALAFDRFASEVGDEEVDHAAFMRRAGELGARMGRARDVTPGDPETRR